MIALHSQNPGSSGRTLDSENGLWWSDVDGAVVALSVGGCCSDGGRFVGLELAGGHDVDGGFDLGDVEIAVCRVPGVVLWNGQLVAGWAADEGDGDVALGQRSGQRGAGEGEDGCDNGGCVHFR